MLPIDERILGSLARAWSVTVAALLVLSAAVALSRIWDGAVFVAGLTETLTRNT